MNTIDLIKKISVICCLLLVILSCRRKYVFNDNVFYRTNFALEKLIIEKGDTSAYKKLSEYYLTEHREKLLSYSLIMANKYHYTPAYYDVYERIVGSHKCLDSLDIRSKLIAMDYLHDAVGLGYLPAKRALKIIEFEN